MNDKSIGNGNIIQGKTQSDEFNLRWGISSFERTLTFSTEAGKAIIYINGGAAVSMLTFCGRYIGNISFWSILSIGAFGGGSLLGVSALLIAYFAQSHFTRHEDEKGYKINTWSLIVGIFSGLFFLAGLVFGALAIWSFNGSMPSMTGR